MKDCKRWCVEARSAGIAAGPSAMGHATLADAELAARQGRLTDAQQTVDKATQFFQKNGLDSGLWTSIAVGGSIARRGGHYSAAMKSITAYLPAARESQDPTIYLRLLLAGAWCEVDLCRLGRAQELVDEIAATLRKGELLALRLEANLVAGRILLASGQHDNAAFVLRETYERAKASHLEVLGESARALLGETMFHLGERAQSDSLFKASLLGLKGMTDRLALADAISAKSRVVHDQDDVEALFKPVASFMETEDVPVLRLERLLAFARRARLLQNTGGQTRACRDAARTLNRLASRLDDTDRAALRVHPWSQRIRLGLPSQG
jgi:hypothetical protein